MSAPTAPSSQSDSAAAPVAYDREQNFDAFDVGSSGINRRPHINVDITANASEEADFEAAKSVIGNLSFSSRATAPLPKSLLKHSRLTAHLGDVNEQHHPQEGSEDKAGDQHSAPTLTTGSISATTRSSLRSSMRRRADNEPPAFTAPSLSAVAEVPRGDSARRRDEPAAASSAPDTRAHSLPPNITIRAAVPSDAPAILETHMASVKGRSMRQMYTEEEIGWWTANRTAESYAEKIVEPNRLWLIAVCSEANLPPVAAFADLSIQNLIPNAPIDAPLPSVYTNGFYVHPAFQGKSVGHCLLEAAESAALKQIIASLSPPVRSQPALKIDFSLHSTLVAVGFYERFQYTPVEKCKHQFVGGGAVSCIKMIKSVDVPPLS